MMYPWIPALTCLLMPLAALAGTPCGEDVPKEGVCYDPSTVTWCEDGLIRTLDCMDGQVCAWNDSIGGFDCLNGQCGADLPAKGHCKHPDLVEWCEAGKVMTLPCGAGAECGWNDGLAAFDCVKKGAVDRHMPEMTDPPDAGEAELPDTGGNQANETGGIPPQTGPPEKETPPVVGPPKDGGCSTTGGAGSGATWPLLLGMCLLYLSRRRASVASR